MRPLSTEKILFHLEGCADEGDYWGEDSEEGNEDEDIQTQSNRRPTTKYTCVELRKEGTVKAETEEVECSLCLDTLLLNEMFPVAGCEHHFCKICLVDYLDFMTKDISTLRHNLCFIDRINERVLQLTFETRYGIKCPARNCGHVLDAQQIQALTDQMEKGKVLERFNRFTFNLKLEEKLRNEFGTCPRCSSLVLPVSWTQKNKQKSTTHQEALWLKCEGCKFEYYCKSSGFTSEEAQLMLKMRNVNFHSWAFNQYAKIHFVKCPYTWCGAVIEKNGGCDHMRCCKCGRNFSWMAAKRKARSDFAQQKSKKEWKKLQELYEESVKTK